MYPTIGRIVIYASEVNNGVRSPAMILRTRETTIPAVIDQWQGPESTLSGVTRPPHLVAGLPDDNTVDLLVFGLGGDYRRYAVTWGKQAGTWDWPERV